MGGRIILRIGPELIDLIRADLHEESIASANLRELSTCPGIRALRNDAIRLQINEPARITGDRVHGSIAVGEDEAAKVESVHRCLRPHAFPVWPDLVLPWNKLKAVIIDRNKHCMH